MQIAEHVAQRRGGRFHFADEQVDFVVRRGHVSALSNF
jgi:hypothetical protein